MARIKRESIPKTLMFLQKDLPELICATGRIEDTSEYWNDLVERAANLNEKYKNDKMVNKFIKAYLEVMDEFARDIYNKKSE